LGLPSSLSRAWPRGTRDHPKRGTKGHPPRSRVRIAFSQGLKDQGLQDLLPSHHAQTLDTDEGSKARLSYRLTAIDSRAHDASRAYHLAPPRLISYRLSGSSAIASQLSPPGLSRYRLPGSSAIPSRAEQLSPLGLSGYRLSSSAAITSQAHQLSPLGLSSWRPSGSAAIASQAKQLSPLGLSS
jgi:hypothetical protein